MRQMGWDRLISFSSNAPDIPKYDGLSLGPGRLHLKQLATWLFRATVLNLLLISCKTWG